MSSHQANLTKIALKSCQLSKYLMQAQQIRQLLDFIGSRLAKQKEDIQLSIEVFDPHGKKVEDYGLKSR